MLVVISLCWFCMAIGHDFPQGAPVDCENGPLPSERAAWTLVEAKAAQERLPSQFVECSAATVLVCFIGVLLCCLCWHCCGHERSLRSEGTQGSFIDLEAGLVCLVDADLQDPPSQVASRVAAVPYANRGNLAGAVADRNVCRIQALVRGSAVRKQFCKKKAACCRIQQAWRARPLDVLGKKLLQHLAEMGAQPALYTSDTFDPEDLVEQQWTDQEKWRAIRLAPVFVHQCPAAAATKCASSFEACRLTLSRLTGDGTEAVQACEV